MVEFGPDVGNAKLARCPVKQSNPKLTLKARNATAYRRLWNPESLRREGKAPRVYDADERDDVVEVHG